MVIEARVDYNPDEAAKRLASQIEKQKVARQASEQVAAIREQAGKEKQEKELLEKIDKRVKRSN